MEQHISLYWEVLNGLCFIDRETYPESTLYTLDEFTELVNSTEAEVDWKRLDWTYRSNWLKENGYEPTQDNLLNSDLEPTPVSEE